MKYVLAFLLSAPAQLYVLWLFYLAVMSLKHTNDTKPLTGLVRAAALSIKYAGLALDAFCNLVWMTLLFQELPREWLVTDRVSRKKKEGNRIAIWMCEQLLDPFDNGCHCK